MDMPIKSLIEKDTQQEAVSNLIKLKLSILKEFQDKYPTSHLGGSLGLLLRGLDLKRDLSWSDLDVTIDEYEPSSFNKADLEFFIASADDFDNSVKAVDSKTNTYVKIDLRICPEPSFDVVMFEGIEYNVSKTRDILFWKRKYADKGIEKHRMDLIALETGERPSFVNTIIGNDDLPF